MANCKCGKTFHRTEADKRQRKHKCQSCRNVDQLKWQSKARKERGEAWKHIQARDILKRAILAGILAKKPCEVCGNRAAQAHHDNYDKPLVVRWLCRSHHQAHHRNTEK